MIINCDIIGSYNEKNNYYKINKSIQLNFEAYKETITDCIIAYVRLNYTKFRNITFITNGNKVRVICKNDEKLIANHIIDVHIIPII